jgi:Fe-S cluster biogenesis protein NfuA
MKKAKLLQKIDRALDEIRPHLAVDGGNVELVDVTDDMHVQIRWVGNCVNCHMSDMTLKAGIEDTLLKKLPAIKGVEAII